MQASTSEAFTTAVDVSWTRRGNAPGLVSAIEGGQVFHHAMWKRKKGKNILILPALGVDEPGHEDGSPHLIGTVETKLYLSQDVVTLDRNGIIRWAHEFAAGKLQASIMHLGGLVLPVVVETSRVAAHWTDDSGEVDLAFVLTCSDIQYPVELNVHFVRCS